MDYDLRVGDKIKTDAYSHGISEYGIVTSFDEDDADYACYANYIRIDDGMKMLMFVLRVNIIHNLSADRRDEVFHESMKILSTL